MKCGSCGTGKWHKESCVTMEKYRAYFINPYTVGGDCFFCSSLKAAPHNKNHCWWYNCVGAGLGKSLINLIWDIVAFKGDPYTLDEFESVRSCVFCNHTEKEGCASGCHWNAMLQVCADHPCSCGSEVCIHTNAKIAVQDFKLHLVQKEFDNQK